MSNSFPFNATFEVLICLVFVCVAKIFLDLFAQFAPVLVGHSLSTMMCLFHLKPIVLQVYRHVL